MTSHPAGWYPDPRGEAAQRYWDGSEWTEHVDGSPASAIPPPPRFGQAAAPGVGRPPFGDGYARPARVYPRNSQAGWALGLAIVGLLCCGPMSIAGMMMGRSEVNAIDRGEADPAQRGLANSGFIVGLIGTVLWVLLLGGYLVLIVLVAESGP